MTKNLPRLELGPISGYRAENMMVEKLSVYLDEHSNLVFPHRHSFYHLVFFTEGSGSHSIDFDRFEVKPNQIYFMTPGQIHTWEFEGEMQGYVVNFLDTYFHSFLLQPDYLTTFSFFDGDARNAVIQLKNALAGRVAGLFEQLLQLPVPYTSLSQDLARIYLLNIFLEIEQQVTSENPLQKPAQRHHVIRDFRKLIEKHFAEKRFPSDYAPLLHVTPNHLNALCKTHLGIQAGQLVRNRMLLEAKRLLVSQDLTVSQISYRLNFADNSYFTKFFKKETGMTPDQFRLNNGRKTA